MRQDQIAAARHLARRRGARRRQRGALELPARRLEGHRLALPVLPPGVALEQRPAPLRRAPGATDRATKATGTTRCCPACPPEHQRAAASACPEALAGRAPAMRLRGL